jgi:hypothetical protein
MTRSNAPFAVRSGTTVYFNLDGGNVTTSNPVGAAQQQDPTGAADATLQGLLARLALTPGCNGPLFEARLGVLGWTFTKVGDEGRSYVVVTS